MRWEFVVGPHMTAWRWQYVDETSGSILKLSQRTFSTLVECVDDAKRNGYTGPDHPSTAQVSKFALPMPGRPYPNV